MTALIAGLLESLFPPSCAACGAVGREPFCRICFEALEPCDEFELPGIDQSHALFAYGGPVALALHALKYQARPDVGRALAPLLAEAVGQLEVDVVLPIPLSKARLQARGYNQAVELVRGLPAVDYQCLHRTIDTVPQVGLSREARHRNVTDAFSVARGADVGGQAILLVDDVITTGATIQSAAACLYVAGAGSIRAMAVARAELGAVLV